MLIKNAACALSGEETLRKMDVRIRGEKIAEISSELIEEINEQVLDANTLEMFPGAIDPHVHFDEPGFTHREDFFHGTMAAARGGVTTVIDMPCTSLPPVITLQNLKNKLSFISQGAVVDFALYGGISGHRIEEALAHDMENLAPFVVGFKAYFISGMETFTAVDHYGFSRAIAKAASLNRPLLLHAEDPSYVLPATEAMKAREGKEGHTATWDDYYESRPECAELSAVSSALALAGDYASSLHIVHVGTAAASELLAAAQERGATCETCPHYLAFSKDDFGAKRSSLKTAPPVKSRGQADRLWKLLSGGKIAFVTSDHAPAPSEEKNTGSLWTDYGGIPGTGTLFPYLYSEGYRKGKLTLGAFLRATSGGAAERFGLADAKGAIRVGMDADLVLVDPKGTYRVSGSGLLSKGTVTPFEGMTFSLSVFMTLVRGRPVWSALEAERAGNPLGGITVSGGYGKHLVWGYL